MSTTTKTSSHNSFALSVLKNPGSTSLLAFAVLAVGVVSGSAPAIIVSGILAFGRPVLYAVLLDAEKSTKAGHRRSSSIRTSVAAAR